MRAIYKGASSGRGWVLVIVTHPKDFPGGKHGTVFPDQTWTLPRGSQTHCLVCTNISTSNWTAHPGSVFLLLYFTNACVFLPAPLGKLPCFMATCHWQGISHQDWNLQPSPKLPTLGVSELKEEAARPWEKKQNCGFRKQYCRFLSGCDKRRPHIVNYKHFACNK